MNDVVGIQSEMTEQYYKIPGQLWLDKLKTAFREVDKARSQTLNVTQWMNSRLRYVVTETVLSEADFKDLFYQIDSNYDDLITWDELVDFLAAHQAVGASDDDARLLITFKAPKHVFVRKSGRKSTCLRARYISRFDEIVTLTENSLTFWSPTSCAILSEFVDDGAAFLDFCFVPRINYYAITRRSRQIIFYDPKSETVSNFVISATVDQKDMEKMTANEARSALSVCTKRRRIPLFNTPTAVEAIPDEPLIFVGDSDGRIEVFEITVTRGFKVGMKYQRLKVAKLHDGAVTQITYIWELEFFLSSGLDGKVSVWTYDRRCNELDEFCWFDDPNNTPIERFVFDLDDRSVLYSTSQHSLCCWRIGAETGVWEETPEHISVIEMFRPQGERPYVITINDSGFFVIYRLPNLAQVDDWHLGRHHEGRVPTYSLFYNQKLYLVGTYVTAWECAMSEGKGSHPHSLPVVGTFVTEMFKKIVTIDRSGDLITWDIETGRKGLSCSWNRKDTNLTCARVDGPGKRIFLGYSDGTARIVAVNAQTALTEFDPRHFKGGCQYAIFGVMNRAAKILICNQSKQVVMFDDLTANRVRFVRNFTCQNENPVLVVILKQRLLLTIGSGSEVLLWNSVNQNPVKKIKLPSEPSIAVDLPSDKDAFIMGDVDGKLHFLSMTTGAILTTINVFQMVIPSALTNVIVCEELNRVLIANMHGYVKQLELETGQLQSRGFFKAHEGAVVHMFISCKYRLLVTAGRDQEIRVWSLDDEGGLVGQLGRVHKWDLNDPATWLKDETLDINQSDFVKEQPPIQDPYEIESESSEDAQHHPPAKEEKSFCLDLMQQLLDQMEDQYRSGKIVVRKAKAKFGENPTVPKATKRPPPRDLSIATNLIDQKEMKRGRKDWISARDHASVNLQASLPPLPRGTVDEQIKSSREPTMSFLNQIWTRPIEEP